MSSSKKDHHCVSCGKLCWGTRCQKCLGKGHTGKVTRWRAYKKQKQEGG